MKPEIEQGKQPLVTQTEVQCLAIAAGNTTQNFLGHCHDLGSASAVLHVITRESDDIHRYWGKRCSNTERDPVTQ